MHARAQWAVIPSARRPLICVKISCLSPQKSCLSSCHLENCAMTEWQRPLTDSCAQVREPGSGAGRILWEIPSRSPRESRRPRPTFSKSDCDIHDSREAKQAAPLQVRGLAHGRGACIQTPIVPQWRASNSEQVQHHIYTRSTTSPATSPNRPARFRHSVSLAMRASPPRKARGSAATAATERSSDASEQDALLLAPASEYGSVAGGSEGGSEGEASASIASEVSAAAAAVGEELGPTRRRRRWRVSHRLVVSAVANLSTAVSPPGTRC